MDWYPPKMTAHTRNYSFGGRGLVERAGKKFSSAGAVAESWEISDCKDTTATITAGEFAGTTLHDLVMQYPDEIVGEGWRAFR